MQGNRFTCMSGRVPECSFSTWELAIGYALKHPSIDRIVEVRPAEVRVWPVAV